MKKHYVGRTVAALVLVFILCSYSWAARIKDIASIGGVRDNQLIGYGLVVGLDGSGDSVKNGFTDQTLSNLLSRQGLSMRDKALKSDNIASVMVTALLPPFAKIGAAIDVMVSSIGDASSLLGGTLLMTPLRGADGKIYAVAQGPVTVGGFSAGGASGKVSKNHTTAGSVPNGGLVERELHYAFDETRNFMINLHRPDFTTCTRLAKMLNKKMSGIEAHIADSGTVAVRTKDTFEGNMIALVSAIESLDIPVDSVARVVLNEKTGTVVIGEKVRISTIAIAHGNLSIQIKEQQQVSQPLPFAPGGGRAGAEPTQVNGATIAPGGNTVVTTDTSVNIMEEKKKLMVVPEGVTIQDVVSALNAIGVSPRDLIIILQAIKAAGALQADLVIM